MLSKHYFIYFSHESTTKASKLEERSFSEESKEVEEIKNESEVLHPADEEPVQDDANGGNGYVRCSRLNGLTCLEAQRSMLQCFKCVLYWQWPACSVLPEIFCMFSLITSSNYRYNTFI